MLLQHWLRMVGCLFTVREKVESTALCGANEGRTDHAVFGSGCSLFLVLPSLSVAYRLFPLSSP